MNEEDDVLETLTKEKNRRERPTENHTTSSEKKKNNTLSMTATEKKTRTITRRPET